MLIINNIMSIIISVKFSSYTPEQFKQVLDHYNSIKQSHHMALEELDRCEGGFQIRLKETELDKRSCAVNANIRQLRWTNRKLHPMNYVGFTEEETLRLYQSLVHVFGESSVSKMK